MPDCYPLGPMDTTLNRGPAKEKRERREERTRIYLREGLKQNKNNVVVGASVLFVASCKQRIR